MKDGSEVEEESQEVDGVQFRGPTTPENEAGNILGTKKYNYGITFDRHPFIQCAFLPKKDSIGRTMKEDDGFSYIYEMQNTE